jgi:two-component system sensor histidine kinase ChiS
MPIDPPADPSSDRPIVLVVDDAVDQIRLVAGMLSDTHRVVFATDGPRALEVARQQVPDVILLDVRMPGMDGFEVCSRLKADPAVAGIPVLFLSASDEVDDEAKGLELGAVDYVTKPINPAVLRKRIETHLRLQRATDRLREHNAVLEQRVAERTAELAASNEAMARFVPDEFLAVIGRHRIGAVNLGDHGAGEMSVMFVDIHDCTRRIAAMSATESFAFVNAFFARLGPVWRAHGGLTVKFTGDGILVLFPEGPRDATAAAVAACDALRSAPLPGVSADDPVGMGVGVATGQVMVGVLGDHSRLQADVMSDTVNLASRLEGLTRHYGVSVVLCERSAKVLAGSDWRLRYLDRVCVKGRSQPLAIHEVIEAHPPALRDAKAAVSDLEEAGWHYFYDRRFGEAVKCFTDVLERLPDDVACRRVLRRAAALLLEGVPDDWTGVTRLEVK